MVSINVEYRDGKSVSVHNVEEVRYNWANNRVILNGIDIAGHSIPIGANIFCIGTSQSSYIDTEGAFLIQVNV